MSLEHSPARNRRFRGTPPPAQFDLATLPDDSLLSTEEVAAVLRKAIGTVEGWRAKQHPLRFLWVDGYVRYTAKAVRGYIAEFGTRGVGRPRKPVPSNNQETIQN
jgi:hypothetical protein